MAFAGSVNYDVSGFLDTDHPKNLHATMLANQALAKAIVDTMIVP
jgi:hypothetical protein